MPDSAQESQKRHLSKLRPHSLTSTRCFQARDRARPQCANAGHSPSARRPRTCCFLWRWALVFGLRSFRRDHLTVLVDAIFGHAVMEDRAQSEIPSRLDSWCPGRSQLIKKALEAQILGQLIERLVVRCEPQ